jgi:hypothetical protein
MASTNDLNDALKIATTLKNKSGKGISSTGNPYALMYKANYGYIFGKPLAYTARTDPNQRVFQKTILRNNTILNIIPGVPYQDSAMLANAEAIILAYNKELEIKMQQPPSAARDKAVMALMDDAQSKLVKGQCDLRYAAFKQDIASFMEAYQMVLNRVGTAVFGLSGGLSRFVTDLAGINLSEDASSRGFKVWVEKGTSISESIDNSYTASVLESAQKSISGIVKQAKFLGMGVGVTGSDVSNSTQIQSDAGEMAKTGTVTNIASRTLSGAVYDFPQVFDSSKFNRSYEISFKFVSPYGDDRSVANYVLFPFLFLLTCATPRQEGTSGHISPFLLQVDAPGFFSCPMGAITSFSFRKGGDEMLFNSRGLPLVIEGSFTVTDLYSNLSLPLSYNQFATNLGTSSFLNTLGGLNLYSSQDVSVANRASNRLQDALVDVIQPFNIVSEETLKLQRFFGY